MGLAFFLIDFAFHFFDKTEHVAHALLRSGETGRWERVEGKLGYLETGT